MSQRPCPLCGEIVRLEAKAKDGALYVRLMCNPCGWAKNVVLKPEEVIRQWYEFREVWGEE